MIAKPIRALELHCPMIQFLKISVIKSESNSHHYNILHFCFEADGGGLHVVSNNRLKYADSQELDFPQITTSKNNFSEIYISRPTS